MLEQAAIQRSDGLDLHAFILLGLETPRRALEARVVPSAWSPRLDPAQLDHAVRLRAFAFLETLLERFGEVVPYKVLLEGFQYEGQRVPLMGPEGIFKPRVLPSIPLSITTAPPKEGKQAPYDDRHADGQLLYRYRGTDPRHSDNVGLRHAMEQRVPLIYLFGVVPGQYMPVWPVFVAKDDPKTLTFSVEIDDRQSAGLERTIAAEDSDDGVVEGRRRYITQVTQRRLHQEAFRARVLRAYHECCAICRLKHTELLEAAHILPDGHPRGEPVVANGLALCKLHHAAFDRNILGIRPDLVIELREEILREVDGPMLRWGLQEFQGKVIRVPGSQVLRPSEDRLAERYGQFRKAG
jgi:putative restriction endonuclease